ncbi:MAG: hypothetical protein QNJ38_14400 [Prochloraceae cyanobacterium]|nr:hypothetical protein [Prochloraceae cyanobacterium]
MNKKRLAIIVPIIAAIITSSAIITAAIIPQIFGNGKSDDDLFEDQEICKSLEISNYTNGQEVPIDIKSRNNQITLQGKTKILKNKTYFLWILGKPDGSSFYYPFGRSAEIDSIGNWSSDGYTKVYTTEKKYTFIPIILSEKEKKKLDSQLPEDRKEKKVINEIPVSSKQVCPSITVKFKPN